jgi:hypothetical protein
MHLLIHGRVGAAFPAGSITKGFGTANASSTGIRFGGGIGFGLSRYLVLEMNGGYARLGAEDGCAACSGSSIDFGLGFSYHLAQGIAFDPWISYGVGFRSMSLVSRGLRDWISDDTSPNGNTSVAEFAFQGLDFTRLALGGDFYPLSALGVGPYFELDLGTTVSRKDNLEASVARTGPSSPRCTRSSSLGFGLRWIPCPRCLRAPVPASGKPPSPPPSRALRGARSPKRPLRRSPGRGLGGRLGRARKRLASSFCRGLGIYWAKTMKRTL